jgi:NAD-dependent DNA ligase
MHKEFVEPRKTPSIDKSIDRDNIKTFNFSKKSKEAIAQLTGIASALIYDGVIVEKEIDFLKMWLLTNHQFAGTFPLSQLHKLLSRILEDNRVTQQECLDVYEFLAAIAPGRVFNPAMDGLFDSDVEIIFKDKKFMFTGELLFGSRAKAQETVKELGGIASTSNGFTSDVDYLIVGDLGSENWAHSRFGNKIQKAFDSRDSQKSKVKIINEDQFLRAVILMDGKK